MHTCRWTAVNGNNGDNSLSLLVLNVRSDDVDRSGYDEEYDDVGGEVFFSGAVASNNPFAVTADVIAEDLAPAAVITEDPTIAEDLAPAAAVAEFNPFATITDDDQEVFDPFQTIHDDDALNVPFSSEDRDTEDDAMSPSRCEPSFDFSI